MTITMDDSKIQTLAQIRQILKSSRKLRFKSKSRHDKYAWIEDTLNRFDYYSLNKKAKGTVKSYLRCMTGFSRAQVTRLICQRLAVGGLAPGRPKRNRFPTTYTLADRQLLAQTDNAHQRLSGPATRCLLQRQYRLHGDKKFERLQNISSAHIYNLRATRTYQRLAQTFAGTKAVRVSIGVRRKPDPQGSPGWIRVDTVHQGDLDGHKGGYHINLVDSVLQWEIVVCVEKISEWFLVPALEQAIGMFPFKIRGFHSDNGSEFINSVVAQLLNKLLIEQTKSRSGRTNDNALVESKNGGVIRKHMGYDHIEQRHAPAINEFYRTYFNSYLNFHRPCGFATVTVDRKGKRHRIYKTYQTPYDRLKSLPNPARHLKEGVTFKVLDKEALRLTDNQSAQEMQRAKEKLYARFDPMTPRSKPPKFHAPRGSIFPQKGGKV
ncbi:MAG: transposase family protein [Elusimicrobia bacterium]|jgi:transposase InsO family protein|nr:transposase family protein [Elusimicrobiota bacterium]